MAKFLNNISLEQANDIQFKTTAGANAGKIEQDGNNLVLSNAVGDILLGDGASDVYIGDGTNNVDIIFEQSGSIKGDGSAVTLTLGGSNTTLNLENPNINGSLSIGATTINNKLTFTTNNGFILFDYEPSGDTAEYTTEVPLLKVGIGTGESTILARISEYRGVALGADDTVWLRAGDTTGVIKTNVNLTTEQVLMSAEGGFHAYGFPGNDTSWANRVEFKFRTDSTTASENGLYIGDGGYTQFIDLSRNLKNIGTINSGAITSTGKITGTELEGTSLDINGDGAIDGQVIITDDDAGALTVRRASNTDQALYLRGGAGSGEGRVAAVYSLDLVSGLSGSNSYDLKLITNAGTALQIDASDSNKAVFSGAITSSGQITGTELEGTSLDINGNADISGNLTMNNGGKIDQGTIYIQDTAAGRIGWNRNTSSGAIHNSSYNAFQAQVHASGADGKFEIQGYTGAGGYNGSFYLNKTGQPLINDYILHYGDEDTKIGFSGSDTFIVHTGGTTALTVDSSQNATFAGDVDINSVFGFNTSTDLLTITNNQNTGGVNFVGGNSRIYFSGYRAIEGATNGGVLSIGEGYGIIALLDNVEVTGELQADSLDIDGNADISGNLILGSLSVPAADDINFTNTVNQQYKLESTETKINAMPFPSDFHDTLAFGRNYTISQEISLNGSSFSSMTLESGVFDLRTDNAVTVIDGTLATEEQAVRYTFTNVAYNSAQFLKICFTYASPAPTVVVTVDTSNDGFSSNSTQRHQSTYTSASSTTGYFLLAGHGGDSHMRVTIDKGNNTDNKRVGVSSIQLLTRRNGDQGQGGEYMMPFDWNYDRDITLLGKLNMNNDGFALDSNTITGINNTSEFTDDDNHIMTSAAVKNKIADNDNNFITSSALPTDFVSAASGGTFGGNVTVGSNSLTAGSLNVNGTANLDNTDIDGTFKMDGSSFDVNGTTTVTIDNSNTTNGVKINTVTSGSPVTIGHTTSEVIIGDNLVVNGNLTTKGDTILESTTNTTIKDTVIQLNDGVAAESANTSDTGILINRGSLDKVFMGWDETADKFVLATTSSAADAAAGTLTGLTTETNYQTLVANIIAPTLKIGFGNSVGEVHPTNTSTSLGTSNTVVPSQNAVKAYVDGLASNYATSAQGTLATNALPKAGGTITGNVKFNDNIELRLGSGADLKAYHSGTHTYFDNNVGDLIFRNLASDKDITFTGNDGGSTITALTLDMSAGGNATFAGNADVAGNVEARGYLQAFSTFYMRGTTQVMNKAADGFLSFLARDTSGSETVMNISNVGTLTTAGKIQTAGEVEGGSLDINGNADISGTLSGNFVVRSTNNANTDGANFAVDTTNKSAAEYAYEVLRSGTTVAGITMVGKVMGTELEGTSLDINGNADISGTLTSVTYQGDVIASAYLDSDTAHLTTTQTFSGAKTFSSSSGVRLFNGTNGTTSKLTFVNTDNNDTSKFIRGSAYYLEFGSNQNEGFKFTDVQNSTTLLQINGGNNSSGNGINSATFAGSVTTGGDIDLPSGSMIDWANGDARIQEGLVNNYSLSFQTYDGSAVTTALRLDGDNTATFAGSITLSGASNEIIKSNGSIRLNIDSDANQTDRIFIVSTGSNSELFKVEESGNGTFAGTVVAPVLQLGNTTLSKSGDNNHVHFVGTALIPNTTTTSSNSNLGTSSYRWKGVYGGLGDFSGNVTVAGTVTANGTTLTGNTGDMLLGTSQDITAHKEFQDNIQARFGSDNDMLIQHTGSHGYWDCETGNMYLRAEADNSHIYLQADDGSGGNTTYIDINGSNERITMMKPVKMDQRRFALTTSTDGDHQGDVVFFGGTSTTVGKIYYYTSSGTWAETNANAVGTADGLLAVALGSSSDTDGMLLRGMVTLNHDPGTIGDPIYLDEANNGQAHSSIPAGTGDIVRVIGYCVHNTQGRIWFNPDNTFVEVA